jgi:ribonucleoside-diphosphate reductase alpha chain
LEEIPEDVKRLFVTAHEVSVEWHVRMQAAFQKYVDNAVSKTINLKQDAPLEDVKKAFLLAWKLKCKGITVYRYGSKKEQVLTIRPMEVKAILEEPVTAEAEYAGGCPADICLH